ncbi:MAG TPA: lysoplasmalogenase [Bryobacteraceae bacterium]
MTKPLLWISLAASILYFATQPWHPFTGSVALKGLCIAPLALLAWRTLPGRDGLLLGLALACGSLGDVLIDWRAALFPAALGAFLIGHFIYIALFWRNRPKPSRLDPLEKSLIAALCLFAVVMSVYLLPATGPLAPAVAMYMGALTGMVISAVALRLPERWVMAGALLFLVSDTVLAISKFMAPVPGREWIIWPAYYAGQLFIAAGFLRSRGVRIP